MSETFSRKLTLYSFIMTMCVVHFHNVGYHNIEVISKGAVETEIFRFFNNFSDSLSYLSLGYFFMVSAFLLYYGATDSTIWEKMKRRMYSLVVPFFLWNLIAVLYRTVLDFSFPFSDWKEMLAKFTLNPQDGPLWYIVALLIFMVPAPLIVKLKKHKWVLYIAEVISLALSVCVSGLRMFPGLKELEYYWLIWELASYLPIYLMGAIAGLFYSDVIIQKKYNKKWVSVIAGILYLLSVAYICIRDLQGLDSWILLRIQPILVWLILDSSLLKKEWKNPIKISFFIYAIHQPILLPILDKLYFGFLTQFPWRPYCIMAFRLLGTALIYVMVLVIASISKHILPKKLYAALSGGRIS